MFILAVPLNHRKTIVYWHVAGHTRVHIYDLYDMYILLLEIYLYIYIYDLMSFYVFMHFSIIFRTTSPSPLFLGLFWNVVPPGEAAQEFLARRAEQTPGADGGCRGAAEHRR